MKLALLKGNRFNPWHLEVFKRLKGNPELTAFRAESEVQRHFCARDDVPPACEYQRIYFDTQHGNPLIRLKNELAYRYWGREPRILPFHDRLREFDLIQTWELWTDWSAEADTARREYGIPLAVMVWDVIPFNYEKDPRRRAIKRRLLTAADVFLVHTDRSRRVLDMEGAPADRVVQLAPGVDLEKFSPGRGDRRPFQIPDDAFVILFVGWFLPRKGLDFLLLAFRQLLNDPALKNQKLRLMVVGGGPDQERIGALIDRLDIGPACVVTGSRPYDQMPGVYRAADLFVLPSIAVPGWQEQFGMALIEAMASGLPVIATLSGAIPEIAGDAAVLCQPNDFQALYKAIAHLVMERAKRLELGQAARARAEAVFDVDRYAHELSDVYDRICFCCHRRKRPGESYGK